MKATKDREEPFYDPTYQKIIQERTQIRRGLWEEHLKSSVAALAKALECLEATNEMLTICGFTGRCCLGPGPLLMAVSVASAKSAQDQRRATCWVGMLPLWTLGTLWE